MITWALFVEPHPSFFAIMGTILSSPVQADPPKQLQSIVIIPYTKSNYLIVNDLVEVLDLFSRHGYSGVSYYNLGLYLGLSPNTLDAIKENNRDDVLACLRECLKAWLKKADDVVKKSGPTIYSLVSALRELGENGVADRIDMESKFDKNENHYWFIFRAPCL